MLAIAHTRSCRSEKCCLVLIQVNTEMSGLSTLNPPLSLPTMKSLFNSRTKRNAAFVALLVWLFALGSGVANACLIQTTEMHGHGSRTAHSSAAETGHTFSPAHANAIPDHDNSLEASKSQCLKVCEDDSQSLPKQQVIFDSTHPVLTPQLVGTWTTAMPVVSALVLTVFQRPLDPGRPIRVRLSRLAL